MDIINELMNTLLPVPVEPAMSKCGMAARSVTRMRPCRSRPMASVNLLGEFRNSGASMISRSAMVCRLILGTSMPMVDLPGMRSIKMDSACSARQIFRETDDAAVLDARFGPEFERRDHRHGIDLR